MATLNNVLDFISTSDDRPQDSAGFKLIVFIDVIVFIITVGAIDRFGFACFCLSTALFGAGCFIDGHVTVDGRKISNGLIGLIAQRRLGCVPFSVVN